MLMKTKKNYRKNNNTINNPKVKNKSRTKNIIKKKKQKKKSRKRNTPLQRGGSVEEEPKIGKTVTIINHPKYNNHKAKIIKYILGENNKNTYMAQLIDNDYNKIFDEIPYLTEDQFKIDQDFTSIQTGSLSNRKIYVLWVVNCDSCKVSTIPYCSSDGIYDTYHYYKSLNEIYNKLKNYLKAEKLTLSFYCSILLRAQETAKIITKGIKDSLPELYTNINTKGITIMNYCQEIQKFETSLSKVLEHVELLNRLIPDTLDVNSNNIMGIQEYIVSETEAPTLVQVQSEETLTSESSQQTNQDKIPNRDESENNPNSVEISPENPLIEDNQVSPEKIESSSHTMIDRDDEIEIDSGNNLVEQPETPQPSNNSQGNTILNFFKGFRKPSSEDVIQNPEKDTEQGKISNDKQIQNGGFLNFMKSLFSNSAKEESEQQQPQQEQTQENPRQQVNAPTSKKIEEPMTTNSNTSTLNINFRTQTNDYQNWKEMVLPSLDDKEMNVVVSHGYYIKKHVLNNVSNSRASNLNAFLLEYTFSDNKLTQVHLLDKELTQKTEITSVPMNIEIKPTNGSHLNKTKDLWNNIITVNSDLKGKEKYSRCYLR